MVWNWITILIIVMVVTCAILALALAKVSHLSEQLEDEIWEMYMRDEEKGDDKNIKYYNSNDSEYDDGK